MLLWPIVIFSVVAVLFQLIYLVIWAVEPMSWSIPDSWWANLIGFMTWDWLISFSFIVCLIGFVDNILTCCFFWVCSCRVQSWKSPYVIYFLVIQLLALLVALVDIYGKRLFLNRWQDSYQGHFMSIVEHLGL